MTRFSDKFIRLRERLPSWLTAHPGDASSVFERWAELPNEDIEPRTQVFREIYHDAQAFAQHYDEKLRTLITALAFLTVAGITLFIFSTPHAAAADITFDGRSWNAANVFFIIFMVSIIFSLASAAAGMDPTAHRPHFLGTESENTDSLLFFEGLVAIGSEKLMEADSMLLTKALASSYATDAYALARRASHKVFRTALAQAHLQTAVIALLLLGLARLPASSPDTRAELIVGAALIASWLPLGTFVLLRWWDYPTVGEAVLWKRSKKLGAGNRPTAGKEAGSKGLVEVNPAEEVAAIEGVAEPDVKAAVLEPPEADDSPDIRGHSAMPAVLIFYFLPPSVATVYSGLAVWNGGSYWAAIGLSLIWVIASRILVFVPGRTPRATRVTANSGRRWLSPPAFAVVFSAFGIAALALGFQRHYPTILVNTSFARSAKGSVSLCVRLHGPPDSTPYVSLNGGAVDENLQLAIPLDADGIGYRAIHLTRFGNYKLRVRFHPTDLDPTAIKNVVRPPIGATVPTSCP